VSPLRRLYRKRAAEMNSATRLNMTFFISAARSRTPPTKKLFASGEKDESGVFDFFDKLSFALRQN
jgi:hypothetical protein